MPNTHVPAAGEAMPAVEGMHIITGRFSRRAMLIGAIASISAAGAAVAAPALPAALTFTKGRRLTTEERLASMDARLALLPPDVAALLRERFEQNVRHVHQMYLDGADLAAVKAYLRSLPELELPARFQS